MKKGKQGMGELIERDMAMRAFYRGNCCEKLAARGLALTLMTTALC